jgi:hypothetical protein
VILKPLYRVGRSQGRTCRTEKSFAGALVVNDDDGEGFTEGEEGCFRVDAVENKSGVVNRLRPLLMRMILIPLSFARNSLELGYFTIIL